MANESKLPNPTQILTELLKDDSMRPRPAADGELAPQLALLRRWQSDRLSRTYADLLVDERHRLACLFFLSDIYAPRDFSQRDQNLEQIHAWLSRLLPPAAIQILTDAVDLNRMTNDLDQRLLHALVDKLGMDDSLTPEQYAEAYRICDNYAERQTQIERIYRLALEVGTLARLPLLGTTLRVARRPVERAGWGEVHHFLEQGYIAFHKMKDPHHFADTIYTREMQILDRIFARHPNPFE
jgi:hypothetical protein